jgi:hypothetical protein
VECRITLGVSGADAKRSQVAHRQPRPLDAVVRRLDAARRLKAMAYGEERPGRRTWTFSPTVITMRSSPTSSGPE